MGCEAEKTRLGEIQKGGSNSSIDIGRVKTWTEAIV